MIIAVQKDSKDPVVFGGKRNAVLRSQNKITQSEYRDRRTQSIWCSGSKILKGNRYFHLDVIDHHRVIYKASKHQHFNIELPKLRNKDLLVLRKLQHLAENKKIPLTFELSKTTICITYDETVFRDVDYQPLQNRVLSIDSNPNRTGWSVLEFSDDHSFRVVESGIVEITDINNLNKSKRLKSSDPKKIKQTNKRRFEILEISKFIVEKAKHYKCCKLVCEELTISPKNHNKGKNFNRLVNNNWNRNVLFNSLQKRCNIAGIELVLVNPAYTSVIGNAVHGSDFPDPICAAIEVGRRGFFKFQVGMFYPPITKGEVLFGHLWKNGQTKLDFSDCDDWKDISSKLKTSKTSYRSSVDDFNTTVCSFKSTRSLVQLIELDDFVCLE
jgi:IS605 OrfB family transposase